MISTIPPANTTALPNLATLLGLLAEELDVTEGELSFMLKNLKANHERELERKRKWWRDQHPAGRR